MLSGIESIRPYFRRHMNAMGFKEHTDAFNFDNIPSTILDLSYHIETPTGGRRGAYDNIGQEIEHDCVVRVFYKGYRNPSEGVDRAMAGYAKILRVVLKSENRLGLGVKNIYLNDVNIRALNASNDNLVLLEITFTCLMEICV